MERKFNAKELDEILNNLPADEEILFSNVPEGREKEIYLYLKSCGNILIRKDTSGGWYSVRLTNVGLKFRSDGGFRGVKKRKLKDNLIKVILIIMGGFISAIFVFLFKRLFR